MRTEIRLIKREPVPKCGTFEVRVSYFFDWEDDASRLRPEQKRSGDALKPAKERTRVERDKAAWAGNGGESRLIIIRIRWAGLCGPLKQTSA